MNKTDLVNAIAATGLSKADSKQALDAVIDAISGATITTNAVTNSVNYAIEAYNQVTGGAN